MEKMTILTELGFSPNEAQVYLSLLKNGPSQTGPIIKDTKLHRVLVYTALQRLEDAGLVTVTRKKTIQTFQPTNPANIRTRIERSLRLAESVIPELQKEFSQREAAVEVKTLKGREGFLTNLYDMLDSANQSKNKTIYIIGGAGAQGSDPFDLAGPDYPAYVAATKKMQIHKKLIISPRYAELYAKEFAVHAGNEMRSLEESLSSPSLTRITENTVSIEIYQPEIIILQIRHPAIALSYLDSFNALWKRAQST